LGGRDSRTAFGGKSPRRVGDALALALTAPPAGIAPRVGVDACRAEFWQPARSRQRL
jgi:hypothetical protein